MYRVGFLEDEVGAEGRGARAGLGSSSSMIITSSSNQDWSQRMHSEVGGKIESRENTLRRLTHGLILLAYGNF